MTAPTLSITTLSPTSPPSKAPLSVAVVVATFNRRAALGQLLDDLRGQDTSVPFEVVVVDDGGHVDLSDVVAASDAVGHRPVRLLRRPNGGPGAARGTGISATTADVIIIVDDDMRVGPTFVGAHLDAHLGGAQVVYGSIAGTPVLDEGPLFARFHQRAIDHWLASYRLGAVPAGARLCTGNVSMRRSGYESVGGFDRELVRCEDRDLGIRLENAGLRFALADDARSTHHTDHGDVRTWRRRSAIYGASDQRIGEKHPQRRDVSPWAFLAELAPPVRPLLIAASVSPRAGKLLGGTSYSLARLVDRLGWHRRAVDLAGLCYALDYYGGVGTRSGSGRNAIASYRSWRSPSTPVMP